VSGLYTQRVVVVLTFDRGVNIVLHRPTAVGERPGSFGWPTIGDFAKGGVSRYSRSFMARFFAGR
jgi:hypothetical protein